MSETSRPAFSRAVTDAAFLNYPRFRREYNDREDFVRALNTLFGADGVIVQHYSKVGDDYLFSPRPASGADVVNLYRDMDTHNRLEFESAFYEFIEEGFPTVVSALADHPLKEVIAHHLANDLATLKIAIADGPGALEKFPQRQRAEKEFLEAHLLGNANRVPPVHPELKW